MYKQASKIGLRIPTPKGLLTVEQAWTISLTDIASSVKALKKTIKASDDDDLGFLDETSKVDPEKQLAFDILKDIYLTKKAENLAKKEEAEAKVHNQRIMEIIANKKDKALENLSVEELEKLMK